LDTRVQDFDESVLNILHFEYKVCRGVEMFEIIRLPLHIIIYYKKSEIVKTGFVSFEQVYQRKCQHDISPIYIFTREGE